MIVGTIGGTHQFFSSTFWYNWQYKVVLLRRNSYICGMIKLKIPISGLDNYEIREDGVLFNMKTGNYRFPKCHNSGYIFYSFFGKKRQKRYAAHRLVALAFIPNIHGKPCINHIDGNKLNNHYSNLEWCTVSENNMHSVRVLGHRPKTMFSKGNKAHKHVACVVTKGLAVGEYESYKSAGRANKVDGSYLRLIALGKMKSERFSVELL